MSSRGVGATSPSSRRTGVLARETDDVEYLAREAPHSRGVRSSVARTDSSRRNLEKLHDVKGRACKIVECLRRFSRWYRLGIRSWPERSMPVPEGILKRIVEHGGTRTVRNG